MSAVLGVVRGQVQPPPQPLFEPAQAFSTGDCCAFAVVVGDVDGDNLPDVIATNDLGFQCNNLGSSCSVFGTGNGSITVFRNTGQWATTGTGLVIAQQIDISQCAGGQGPTGPTNPHELALACLNGDTRPDLVVTTDRHVVVYQNTGDPNQPFTCDNAYVLPEPNSVVGQFGPSGVVVADFDNDGFNDIGVANRADIGNPPVVWIMFNDGLGGFSGTNAIQMIRMDRQAENSIIGATFDVAAGRFDNVLGWDLVTCNLGDNSVSIVGSIAGTSYHVTTTPAPGNTSYANALAIARARLDAGTNPDVALAISGFTALDGATLLGDGMGNLTFKDDFKTAIDPTDVAAARVNTDAARDLVYVLYGSNGVAVLLGKGDGTFPYAPLCLSVDPPSGLHARYPRRVDIADLNDDGLKDIVVSAREGAVADPDGSGRVSVILGKYGAPE